MSRLKLRLSSEMSDVSSAAPLMSPAAVLSNQPTLITPPRRRPSLLIFGASIVTQTQSHPLSLLLSVSLHFFFLLFARRFLQPLKMLKLNLLSHAFI